MSGRGDVEEIEPGLLDSNGDTILLYSRVFMIASISSVVVDAGSSTSQRFDTREHRTEVYKSWGDGRWLYKRRYLGNPNLKRKVVVAALE